MHRNSNINIYFRVIIQISYSQGSFLKGCTRKHNIVDIPVSKLVTVIFNRQIGTNPKVDQIHKKNFSQKSPEKTILFKMNQN